MSLATRRAQRGLDLRVGDCLEVLPGLPSEAFQACVTSPPYWGLRDYGVQGQIGAETQLDEYLRRLVAVFREVRRVLRPTGTLWLNIGDCYTSGGRKWRATDPKNPARGMSYRAPTPDGLKRKDLVGLPWRVAFALQADGWYLRSDIVWAKPNPQPESVRDRPTRSHEYLFLFSKSEHYFYSVKSVEEDAAVEGAKRRQRSVWTVKTVPIREAHFAVFPPGLVEPCLLAATRPSDAVLDPFFGSGTVGLVAAKLGRRCVGVELNPEYAAIARKRLASQSRLTKRGTREMSDVGF